MGRFASFDTPITVNLMSGVIGSALVLFVFLITRGSLADFFSVMIALAISATAMCVRVPCPGRAAAQVPARAAPLPGSGRHGRVAIPVSGPGAAVACLGRGNGQRAPRRCPAVAL